MTWRLMGMVRTYSSYALLERKVLPSSTNPCSHSLILQSPPTYSSQMTGFRVPIRSRTGLPGIEPALPCPCHWLVCLQHHLGPNRIMTPLTRWRWWPPDAILMGSGSHGRLEAERSSTAVQRHPSFRLAFKRTVLQRQHADIACRGAVVMCSEAVANLEDRRVAKPDMTSVRDHLHAGISSRPRRARQRSDTTRRLGTQCCTDKRSNAGGSSRCEFGCRSS